MACIKDGKYHFTYHYFAALFNGMLASKTATGLSETFSRDWYTRTVSELSNYCLKKLNIHPEFKCDGDISSKDSSNFDDAVKMGVCLGDIQAWLNLETKARTFYLLVLRVLQNTAEYDAYVVDLLSKIISLPNTDLSHKAQREEYFSQRYKERVRLNQWSTVTAEEILESFLKKWTYFRSREGVLEKFVVQWSEYALQIYRTLESPDCDAYLIGLISELSCYKLHSEKWEYLEIAVNIMVQSRVRLLSAEKTLDRYFKCCISSDNDHFFMNGCTCSRARYGLPYDKPGQHGCASSDTLCNVLRLYEKTLSTKGEKDGTENVHAVLKQLRL